MTGEGKGTVPSHSANSAILIGSSLGGSNTGGALDDSGFPVCTTLFESAI